MALLSTFAGVAVLLAAIGLYGVVSYAVRQQTHELGVRLALGASRADVVRLVVGNSLKVTMAGATLGTVAALAASSSLRAMLFGVSATDPLTYAGVVLVILAVGVLASWLPARRATAIDPVSALRSE
jgi:ABC-type antimicrobial peptide transport system permease subunit